MNNKVLPTSMKEQISAGSNWSTETKVTSKQKKEKPRYGGTHRTIQEKKYISNIAVQLRCLFWFQVVYFFFSCSNWTRTCLPYPLPKVIVTYPIPALFIIHLLIWNFILQTSCYWKSFEKCLLWPLRCLLKRNIILKYNCAADLAHWCLTE